MQRTKGLWRLLCTGEILSEAVRHLETHVDAGDNAGNNTDRDYTFSPAHRLRQIYLYTLVLSIRR